MPKHADDDPVMVGYSASSNISFRSQHPEELGPTWGDWRQMTKKEQDGAMAEYLFALVDLWVEEDED